MQLKSIEITGFKSFPEKTKIDFHQGMTAIVGPNGSGKSNITDAIRWVLGEQNAKVLRGKKMEDLIFSGTQNRRQMGYAEVNLIFDNSDKTLSLPYDEVKFSRRLYRSGESEYSINQQNCRLKDIQKLILDTGVGRSGYAIVGQGRVDEILSPKSEDRRHVFDEAAGISKFRAQRDESHKKLDEAMYNLARVQDILGEMEIQLAPLKAQAEVAQKFLALQQEKKDWEQVLFIKEIELYEEHLANEHQKCQSLAQEEKRLEQELLSVTQLLEELKLSLENLKREEESLHQAYVQDVTAQERLKGQQALQIQEEQNLLQSLAYLESLQQEKQEEKEKLHQESTEKEERKNKLLLQKKKMEEQQLKLSAELAQFVEGLEAQEKALEDLRASILEKQDAYFEKRTLYSEANSYLKALNLQLKDKEDRVQHLLLQKDRYAMDFEEQSIAYERLKKKKEAVDERYQALEALLNEARKSLTEKQEQEKQGLQYLQNLKYKHQTLEQLSKNYEGYAYAVKALLTHTHLATEEKKKIKGPVAELLKVDEGFETAIDIALGALQQNVVVEDQDTAKYCIELLKKEHLGRATFLPLKQLYFKPVDAEQHRLAKAHEGFLGLASERVFLSKDLEPLADFLLGRCFVVETLEQAKTLSKKMQNKAKIVTLEGDLIQPGGAMTGGSLKEKQGKLLSRKNQMEQLKAEQEKIIKQLENLKVLINQEENELQQHLTQFEAVIVEKKQLEEDFSFRKIEHEHQQKQALQLDQALQKLKEERLQLENEKKLEQEKESQNFEAAESIQREIKEIRQILEKNEQKNKGEIKKRDDLRESLSDLKFSIQSMEEALSYQEEQLNRLKEALEKEDFREDKAKEEKQDLEASLQKNREEQAQLKEELLLYNDKESLYKEGLSQLEQKRQKVESDLEIQLKEEKSLLRQFTQAENEKQKWESLQKDLLDRLADKRSTLWEQHGLTYEQCLQLLQTEGEKAPWAEHFLNYKEKDFSKLEKRIASYQKDIEALGPVNVAAIEAEKLLLERYDFLKQQAEDLLLSKAELEKIIQDLTEEMKKLFLDSFEKINESFNESFKALFGGGMASLELEDQKDPLQTNIEIKVCPPGKRLQNMLLLSGGEKALSAIALLFAILQLRPSPFVILDEIEAALDEANVHRFAHYVKNFCHHSQFILVTHRKGTMEACERIYGVTMQEKGISRILSLKLSKAAETEAFLKALK